MKICISCWTGSHDIGVGAQRCMCCATGHGTGEDMAVIVYDPKLHGDDDVRRNRVREWLETNGLDTRHVSVNGVIRVEGSHVHFLGNVLGEDGERCVSQDPEIAGAPVLAGMSARLKVEWTEEEDNG